MHACVIGTGDTRRARTAPAYGSKADTVDRWATIPRCPPTTMPWTAMETKALSTAHATKERTPAGPSRRPRLSLHGAASVAPSNNVHTHGATTYDYDVHASLCRQQARRRRGDSNASISTVASALSTTPSRSGEHAHGRFIHGAEHAYGTHDGEGEEWEASAAGRLHRIRTSSMHSSASTPSLRHDSRQATSTLSEALEHLIARSASYRTSSQRAQGAAAPHGPGAVPSSASARHLGTFLSTMHRQTAQGTMRSTMDRQSDRAQSLFAFGAARAPTMTTAMPMAAATLSPARGSATARGMPARYGHADAMASLRGLPGVQGQACVAEASKGKGRAIRREEPRGSHAPCKRSPDASCRGQERGSVLPAPASHPPRTFHALDPTSPGAAWDRRPATTDTAYAKTHQARGQARASTSEQSSANALSPCPDTLPALDGALARAEEQSGLHTSASCTQCGKKAVNAPLTRAGDVFCSRVCRMETKQRAPNKPAQAPAVAVLTSK